MTKWLDTSVKLSGDVYLNVDSGQTSVTGRQFTYAMMHMVAESAPITAHAGGGQASATTVGYGFTEIGTCASAGDSVKMPSGAAVATIGGMIVVLFNATANACNVFPQSGGTIGTAAVDTAFSLPAGKTGLFVARYGGSGIQWSGGYLG